MRYKCILDRRQTALHYMPKSPGAAGTPLGQFPESRNRPSGGPTTSGEFVEEVTCIDQSLYYDDRESEDDISATVDGHEMMQKEVSETDFLENKTPHKDRFMQLEDSLLTFTGPYANLNEITQGRKEHTFFFILDNTLQT